MATPGPEASWCLQELGVIRQRPQRRWLQRRWLSSAAIVAMAVNPLTAFGLMVSASPIFKSTSLCKPRSLVNYLLSILGFILFAFPLLLHDGLNSATLWMLANGGAILLAGFVIATTPSNGKALQGWIPLLTSAGLLALPAALHILAPGFPGLWWVPHDNSWAAFAVMSACAVAPTFSRSYRQASVVILVSSAMLVVLATGSRTGLLGLMAGALAAAIFGRIPWKWSRGWGMFLLAGTIIGVGVFLASPLSLRISAWPGEASTNLLLGSEELNGALWTKRGVMVEKLQASDGYASFLIQSDSGDSLDRVHQRVVLAGGVTRTLTVEFQNYSKAGGIVAFSDAEGRLMVPFAEEEVRTQVAPPTLVRVARSGGNDDWHSLSITLRNDEAEAIVWRVGIAPSFSAATDQALIVKHVRLNDGDAPRPYQPTYETDRVSQLAAISAGQRLGYVSAAAKLFLAQPWLGYGSSKTFFELMSEAGIIGAEPNSNVPVHAHSLIGDILVRSGLCGLFGFLLMVTALIVTVPKQSRYKLTPLLVAIVVLGLGDATLFDAGGIFVLASIAIYVR